MQSIFDTRLLTLAVMLSITACASQCDAIHLYWNHDTRGLA